ncbi:hypothetical protein PG994_012431 [Apiospora phragmitis]|uniref:Geranylgeranyl pyrophosphate synthetase n=1 Tax=Apiospora phragmitis TaxID=2905665 RepID=A0ABR1TVM4_9PEZI
MKSTISRKDLEGHPSLATISNVQHLSSYSWIESPEPTIVVPGVPPKWQPPRREVVCPKDLGFHYIAQNAACHPDSPMEPLFRALYQAGPSFDVRNIDVVTDRNNLRKLLSFVDPKSTRFGLEAFTIHAELAVENTVIISRVEAQTHEIIGPEKFVGYDHEFEKAYTTCEIPNSTGHHRVITYSFRGLSYVVRYEADAYVDAQESVPQVDSKSEDSITSITSNIDELSLGSGSNLSVRKQGQIVPLDSTLEIKTRVAHKPIGVDDLWIFQTPKLVRAYYRYGPFGEAHVEDVTDKVMAWERAQQPSLKKLAALMTKLTEVVKGLCGSCVIRCCSEKTNELVSRRWMVDRCFHRTCITSGIKLRHVRPA